MTAPILCRPNFETANISDRLFSQLSLRHIRAVNIKERVRLDDVCRDIDLARRMMVFEIEHASKLLRKRQDTLRAHLNSGRTTHEPNASRSCDTRRFPRSHTSDAMRRRVELVHHHGGTSSAPPVGCSTVRSCDGLNLRDMRPNDDVNIAVIDSSGDVHTNIAPNRNGNQNGSTLPSVVVQPPDEHSNGTPSTEVINFGHEPLSLLASILRADDADQETTMNLRVPAVRFEPKCRLSDIMEVPGETETSNTTKQPYGILPRRDHSDEAATCLLSNGNAPDMHLERTCPSDAYFTSGDAHLQKGIFQEENHHDGKQIVGETKVNYRVLPERTRQRHVAQPSDEKDRRTGLLSGRRVHSGNRRFSFETETRIHPLLNPHMSVLPSIYTLNPQRRRWRDLSGTTTSDKGETKPELHDVKWCRYLRYPSGKGRPSDVPPEYA